MGLRTWDHPFVVRWVSVSTKHTRHTGASTLRAAFGEADTLIANGALGVRVIETHAGGFGRFIERPQKLDTSKDSKNHEDDVVQSSDKEHR